jgi:hypothetical protein
MQKQTVSFGEGCGLKSIFDVIDSISFDPLVRYPEGMLDILPSLFNIIRRETYASIVVTFDTFSITVTCIKDEDDDILGGRVTIESQVEYYS